MIPLPGPLFLQAPPQAAAGLDTTPSRIPTFSIITASKNSAETIVDCVNSVARQTLPGVEHVVVDSHSQDGTLERIYAQRDKLTIVYGSASDTRFQAWNRGIGQAAGDVIGFVNPNDALAYPDVLRQVAEAFEDPWTAAVYGDILCVDARDSAHVRRHNYLGPITDRRLARGWVPPITALFVRKSWYRRIDGFAPGRRCAADYAASLRLFAQPSFKAVYLGKPVVRRRMEPLSLRQLRRALTTPTAEWKALRDARVGGWQTLVWNRFAEFGHWL